MDNNAKRAINELKYADEDRKFMTISIDFDATSVSHNYPYVGEDLPECVETLKRWHDLYDVQYILNTMRSGKELEDAVNWFREKEIPLFGIQKHPTQHTWTDSPKCHARWNIDDRDALMVLTTDEKGIPCVDWGELRKRFEPTLKAVYEVLKEQYKKEDRRNLPF